MTDHVFMHMCPVTENYIKNEYYDSLAHIPVRINGQLEKKLIFPEVLAIEQELLNKG